MPSDAVDIPQGLIGSGGAALPGGAALYETDLFRPTYRPMQGARWRLDVVPLCMVPGYWSGPQVVTDMAALVRDEGDGKGCGPVTGEWRCGTGDGETDCRGTGAAADRTRVAGLSGADRQGGGAVVERWLRPDVAKSLTAV
jgi:hypothetical protein